MFLFAAAFAVPSLCHADTRESDGRTSQPPQASPLAADFQEPLSLMWDPSHPTSRMTPAPVEPRSGEGQTERRGWVTILSETGEGSFPGSRWDVSDLDPNSGEDTWDDVSCRKFRGSKSIWSSGKGNRPDCSNYDLDMFSWMIHGPFDLSDAIDAHAEFFVWSETEAPEIPFDFVFWGASTDGVEFSGFFLNTNTDWTSVDFDMTNVPGLGDLTGRDRVWFAFAFVSDFTINNFEGSYVDNILIEKRLPDVVPPDLIVPEVSVSNDTLATGELFNATAVTRNQGEGIANSTTVRYLRSADPVITAADFELASRALPRLDPGAEAQRSEEVSIDVPGTFWIGACVDAVPDESNVNNNCSTGIEVVVGTPDLVVTDIAVSNENPEADETFTIDATALNQGDRASESTTLRYYRSDDSAITIDDVELGSDAVSALEPGGTSGQSELSSIPMNGNYWIGACVDAVSDESLAANNCSYGVPVDVGTCVADQQIELTGLLDGTETFEACGTITLGPDLLITGRSNITLRAGTAVNILQPVQIEEGATVRIFQQLPVE